MLLFYLRTNTLISVKLNYNHFIILVSFILKNKLNIVIKIFQDE